MTIEPLEIILTDPGCFYVEIAKTNGKYREEHLECNRCDGHKTSCKNYLEKSQIKGQVKPENVVNTSEVAYNC